MTNQRDKSKTWRFFRAGGFDQVKLESGADLLALDQLDLKLWVALACPAAGLEFDQTTLSFLDADKDGRIHAPDIIAAAKWACSLLKNPDDLFLGAPALRVSAINDSIPEGKAIANFARQILGKSDADLISVDEAAAANATLAAKKFNGDGIVTADAAPDEPTAAAIHDIISCLGPDPDASGKPGVSQPKVDLFFAQAAAYSDWWKLAEGNETILPLGPATAAAANALQALQPKLDDFFARCRLAAFDPRSTAALNRDEKDFVALAPKDLNLNSPEIAALPLARIQPAATLPLAGPLNPAWTAHVAALANDAVNPLLGPRDSLSEDDWAALKSRLAPFNQWSGTRPAGAVEKLGLERIRLLLASDAKPALAALIADDQEEQAAAQAILGLNRLVRYHRDLVRLCLNFVSFRDFYGRKRKAVFQAGTLFLDQRSCDLCLRVDDPAKHALLAGMAGAYLAYCDVYRKGSGEKMQIVAAFTGGDSENLMVGRNGLFFDAHGRDWDATITRIVDNPISLRQAFFSPYKKLVRLVEEQVAKRAAAAEAEVDAKMAAAAKSAAAPPPPKPVEPPKPGTPPKGKIDTGTLAAIGLVLTTLLTALASLFGYIAGLPWWQIPLAVVGLLLLVSTPSMILAYLKLRRRNLGPILDANGWAINARAKITVPFGGSLTALATLPPGSQRDLVDPYAEKKSIWPKLILALVILGLAFLILNRLGYIYDWSNGRLGTPPAKAEATPATNAPAPTATSPMPKAP